MKATDIHIDNLVHIDKEVTVAAQKGVVLSFQYNKIEYVAKQMQNVWDFFKKRKYSKRITKKSKRFVKIDKKWYTYPCLQRSTMVQAAALMEVLEQINQLPPIV